MISCRALREQTVARVDANAEQRAAQVMLDDTAQGWQYPNECAPVIGDLDVAVQRVKEPERRVGGVVQSLVAPVGEHVRDQAIADVVRERPEDESRLAVAAGDERQPLEADHRIATPIGKPMVAGDDRANLVTRRRRARGIDDASGGREDELIRRQHELRRDLVGGLGMRRDRGVEKPAPALFLPAEGFRRRERGHHFLGLRRRDKRHRLVRRERELKVAGRPQRPAKLVAALLLDGIEELARHPLLVNERGGRAADAHAKRRQLRITRLEHVAAG